MYYIHAEIVSILKLVVTIQEQSHAKADRQKAKVKKVRNNGGEYQPLFLCPKILKKEKVKEKNIMCRINGKKLSELRKEAGMSATDIAKQVGVSSTAIKAYEENKYDPKDDVADKICLVLNINKNDIAVHDVGYNFLNQESKTVAAMRGKKGFIRYITPKQTEKWIESKREISMEDEVKEVHNALKNSFGIGLKKYILISPNLLHIPAWQRNTDMAKAAEIAENFNEDKFDPIKAYVTAKGTLEVADGAHRVIAFIIKEEVKILVEVLNCTEDEAVFTFLGQQSGRKTMTISDMYRAGVKANIEEYTRFKELFEDFNIQITVEDKELDNPIGKITPSNGILRFVIRDREMLVKVINLIKKLEWCGSTSKNAFELRNFKVLKKLYATYGDEAEEKLLKYCSGATFYENKVVPIKSNAELYDILSSEINK